MPDAKGPTQDYLVVARIVSPQGNRGEVKAELVTDFPERFASTTAVYLGDEHRRYTLEGHRLADRIVILKLEGIDSIAEAEQLRGAFVEIPESDAVELPAGHYFWHQIIGLRVIGPDGQEIGVIDDILQTGANDVYVVRNSQGEVLIPAIKDVVDSIDLDAGTMVVSPMEWG